MPSSDLPLTGRQALAAVAWGRRPPVRPATLLSLRARRTGAGRDVRVRLRAGEPLTVRARLSRDGRTLARRSRSLRAGKRTLRLPIETGTRTGGAQLTLVLTDAAGNRRVSPPHGPRAAAPLSGRYSSPWPGAP